MRVPLHFFVAVGAIAILAIAPIARGADAGGSCQLSEEKFLSELEQKRDWNAIYQFFSRNLPNCPDDGAFAEGYSDVIVYTFAKRWSYMPQLVALVARDRGFHSFVLRHIDATADPDELKLARDNATTRCPPDVEDLCEDIATRATEALRTDPRRASFTRPVTVVNGGKGGTYGNDVLEVALGPQSRFVFEPGGPGFVESDGALGIKFFWKGKKKGRLEVGGRRLDGEAKPVRAYLPAYDYGETGGGPGYLVFPTPGCWQVTGYLADGSLTFVVFVEKIEEGPSWRFEGIGRGDRVSSVEGPN